MDGEQKEDVNETEGSKEAVVEPKTEETEVDED